MSDRILSEETVDSLEMFAMKWNSNPRQLGKPCVDLCRSHRLLAARVKELETTVGWYEEKHPND